MSTTYPEPVAKLLTYGEPETTDHNKWPNYPEQTGIELAHVPDLVRLIGDKELRTTDPDEEDPKYWGPVHAWRTLGQLKATEAVKPLLDLAHELFDVNSGFDSWAISELPTVYGLIGKSALPLLTRYVADPTYVEDARINAGTGIEYVAKFHPEAREEVVTILTHQLEAYEDNPAEINAYLIGNLADLKVQEALPLIQRIFASKKVDESIIHLDDALIGLGLKEAPPLPDLSSLFSSSSTLKEGSASLFSSSALKEDSTSPRPFPSLADTLSAHIATPSAKYFASPTTSPRSTKKAKQKMAKASKKKNRRK
jgi:hypothetical protein